MTRPFQMHNLQNPYITSDFDDRRSRSTSLFYHYPAQNAMLQQKLFQLFNKHPMLCWFFFYWHATQFTLVCLLGDYQRNGIAF